jgi:hypothetical protein
MVISVILVRIITYSLLMSSTLVLHPGSHLSRLRIITYHLLMSSALGRHPDSHVSDFSQWLPFISRRDLPDSQ